MKYSIYLLFVLGLLFPGIVRVNAQQIKNDLLLINKAYSDLAKLQIDVVYKAEEKSQVASEAEMETGRIIKNKNYLYNKIGAIETIVQDSLHLVVDHQKKMMLLMQRKMDTVNLNLISPGIQDALANCKRINSVKTASSKGYELWMDEKGEEKVLFTYNPNTFLIERFEFFYKQIVLGGVKKENVKVGVEYTYSEASPVKLVNMYDFVQFVNGGYISKEQYKEYQLIDYTVLSGKNLKR